MTAPIDESVSLLVRADPDVLQRIRSEHPDEASLLSEGLEAGPEDATEARERANAKIKTKVAAASIKSALKEYQKWFPRLRRRLAKAQQAAFFAQVLSIVAGASIFTNSAVPFPTFVKILCGMVALAASVCSLLSSHLLKPLGQDGSNMFDVYKRLAEVGARAALLDRQIDGWMSAKPPVAPDDIIASANETCQTLNQLAPLFIE